MLRNLTFTVATSFGFICAGTSAESHSTWNAESANGKPEGVLVLLQAPRPIVSRAPSSAAPSQAALGGVLRFVSIEIIVKLSSTTCWSRQAYLTRDPPGQRDDRVALTMSDPVPRSAHSGRAVARLAMAIAGLAAVLQALLFALERGGAGRLLWGDEVLYLTAARRVLRGGPSELDPLWPPLYPHLLAALGVSHLAVEIAQTLLLAATALLLGDLARRAYGGQGDGHSGALVGVTAGGLL